MNSKRLTGVSYAAEQLGEPTALELRIGQGAVHPRTPSEAGSGRTRQRPRRRQLYCPAHPEQLISGTGKKYFIHLLSSEELKARGMSDKKARLVIQAYPVLVLSNEWLEEMFCVECGQKRWCHLSRDHQGSLAIRWAHRDLWQQVAHVDPLVPNPSVGEFTRRQARRLTDRRADGKRLYD
jgi:hypothetical protein